MCEIAYTKFCFMRNQKKNKNKTKKHTLLEMRRPGYHYL